MLSNLALKINYERAITLLVFQFWFEMWHVYVKSDGKHILFLKQDSFLKGLNLFLKSMYDDDFKE